MRAHQERDERPDDVKRAAAAIHAAAAAGRVDDLRRLLDASPELLDARRVDRAGQTALHRAAWNDRGACVLVAARKPAAVRWLIDHGVDVNAKRVFWDCNSTALHVTAEHGLVDLARMLLDAGADPAIRDDKYDATVLEWARYCDQPRIAELLQSRGVTA